MKKYLIVVTALVLIIFGFLCFKKQNQIENSVKNNSAPNTETEILGDGTGLSENLILGINVSAEHGEYLSAYNGMTVYTSSCFYNCAENWIPYAVSPEDRINIPAVIKGEVNIFVRKDGINQIIYNGIPLYFSDKDSKPGDLNGLNAENWFLVRP